jgi:hypothetical protein
MTATDYAKLYGTLAWLIPSLLTSAAFLGYCFWLSRDRPAPRRRHSQRKP